MDDGELFVRSLDELHRAINSRDEYEVLKAAAIIRKLFLDGGASLADRVNRTLRLNIDFEVVEFKPPDIPGIPAPQFWGVMSSMDPRVAPPHLPRVRKSRDAFFNMRVGLFEGQEYSVGDVIRLVAHVMGAVHSGRARTPQEQVLAKLKEFRFGSNLSFPLLQLRAIGRIVLESLKELNYSVLGLERFENSPGMSFHLALKLHPLEDDTPNYILDIGTDLKRNRVSIYLDGRGELCFRHYDGDGRRHLIRAGQADCAYSYGVPAYLSFEMGSLGNETMLSVSAGDWVHTSIHQGAPFPEAELHFVLGSDVKGKALTHVEKMELCVYSRCLTLAEKQGLARYFAEKIEGGYGRSVLFQGNQFLHSQDHPNFVQAAAV